MVDAVQQRNDHGVADAFGTRELESPVQLRRLRRHPEDIDISVERRRGRDVDREIAEHDALDPEAARMLRDGLRPEQEEDVCADARERSGDQAPDAACSENRVPHASDGTAGQAQRAAARARVIRPMATCERDRGACERHGADRGRRRPQFPLHDPKETTVKTVVTLLATCGLLPHRRARHGGDTDDPRNRRAW